jgi:hypothetical protein
VSASWIHHWIVSLLSFLHIADYWLLSVV